MKTLPTLSFLLVVSRSDNAEKLNRCLISLRLQTSNFKEVIIVKNGKLENEVLEILKDFKTSKFKKVLVNSQSQLKFGPALNLGLKKVNSDYILRIDPDDINLKNRVKTVKKDILNKNFDLGIYQVYEKKSSKLTKVNKFKNTTIKKNFLIINPVFHSSVVIKTKTLQELGGYRNIEFAEDYDLWLRFILANKIIQISNKSVVIYDNNNFQFRRKNLKSLKGEISILKLKNEIYKNKIFNFIILILRIVYKFLPIKMMNFIYKNFILSKN